MGLLDKIKDNAKSISIRALDDISDNNEDEHSQQPDKVIKPTKKTNSTQQGSIISSTEESIVDQLEALDTEKKGVATESTSTTNETKNSTSTTTSDNEHTKQEKVKEQDKIKQEAKERLAKSYTPSYKKKVSGESENKDSHSHSHTEPANIVDITPHKGKKLTGASYARERAAIKALASQRKIDGTVPMYITTYMKFKVKVYIDRIEYSGSFGKNIIPIKTIAWIKLRHSGTGVILELTNNKKMVLVIKLSDRVAFTDAVLRVQAIQPKKQKIKDKQTVRIDQLDQFSEGLDELEKLAKLYDKGILTKEEFDLKKKQILGL